MHVKHYYSFVLSLLMITGIQAQTTKTVGTSGDYTTLKAAFDAINLGSITGIITLKVISSTTETATALLNASGTGSASYSKVLIYPTGGGYTIGGNLALPLIDLSGVTNVIIDGRVNATGATKALTIVNSSNSGTSNTATIRFISSAKNDTLKYCTVQGCATGIYSGVILFAGASSGNGNSGNVVDHCDLTGLNSTNRPYYVIYSYGSSGHVNSNNIISNNNFYNFFSTASGASYVINLNVYTSDWIITGNSLYETTTFSPVGLFSFYGIKIANTSGNNFVITNNYIGGSAPLCGGAPWTLNANYNYRFYCIHVDAGTTTPTSIQNNTIKNFSFIGGSDIPWMGIDIDAGSVNVGTITGNTIGETNSSGSISLAAPVASASATVSGGAVTSIALVNGGSGYTSPPTITFNGPGSGATATATISGGSVTSISVTNGGSGYTYSPSVMFNSSSSNSNSYGIYVISTGTVNVSNNTIGSVTTFGTTAYSHGFYGISRQNASTGTATISNNLVGSLTQANSIQASTSSNSSTAQNVYGIYSASTGTTTISNNVVANLYNAYAYIYSTNGQIAGICTSGGVNSILNNTVRNLSTINVSNDLYANASIIGISQKSTSAGQTVSGNTIYALTNNTTYGRAITVTGLYYAGGINGTNVVSGNFIYGLTVSSALATIFGININTGATTYYNNIINLGGNSATNTTTTVYGIYETGPTSSDNNNLYFNTVYICGTLGSGSSKSYALYSALNLNTRNFRNNIFENARSTTGGSGLHYGAYFNYSTGGNLTVDYNDYFTPGTGGMLGYFGGSKSALPIITGQDANSQSINPGFVNPGGTAPNDYMITANLNGVSGTGITVDFNGITRGSPPKMGALESNNYIWQGGTSTDFGTASNWVGGDVPLTGATISFSSSPSHDCLLDQNRIVGDIYNGQSTYKLKTNGHQLTINGNLNLTNSAQIDATSASSIVMFAGTATQSIPSGAFVSNTINSLTLNNSFGMTLNEDLTITQALTLTNGALVVGPKNLTITGNSLTRGTGTIDASNASATLIFANPIAITLPASVFSANVNNLTITGSGGITSNGNFTVNGTLNLQSFNPSAIKGCLDMGTNTLSLGTNAPITGAGDVTGIVERSAPFNANVQYTFGNQFTSISFASGGTFPTQIQVKISIGTTFSWMPSAILRCYDFIQTSGVNSYATLTVHYLDSELNGNNENTLSYWTYGISSPPLGAYNWGRANYNTTNDWVEIDNVNFGNFPSTFGKLENTLSNSSITSFTWNGSVSNSWTTAGNWTPQGSIGATSNVIIPDASTTTNEPTLPTSTEVTTLTINSNGVLNSGTNSQITINGANGAWSNNGGTFNPGTSTVIFSNSAATISGTNNFNNVTIQPGALLLMTSGSIMRIAGIMTNTQGTWRTVIGGPTTVEYNGTGDQNIVVPNPSTDRYSTLILSGSGNKNMPSTALSVYGSFSISGAAVAIANANLTLDSNFTIENGASFTAGAFNHSLIGNFINDGTFTSTGSTFTFNGTSGQLIEGSNSATFGNLNIANASSVTLTGNITVTGNLSVSTGTFDLAGNTANKSGTGGSMTVSNGAILKIGGTNSMPINYSTYTLGTSSTVEYDGTDQTVSNESYGNLILAGSGSKTLGGTLTTVQGDLIINSGVTLTIGAGQQLTVQGNTYLADPGCLIIESTASGTGSFIDNGFTGGGTAFVSRYISQDQWHFTCIPTTSPTPTLPFNGLYVKYYTESNHNYHYVISNDSTLSGSMVGYAIWSGSATTGNATIAFSGALNTGTISIPVTRTWDSFYTTPDYDGWNLVGNPYPSSLDLSLVTSSWTKVDHTAWFWSQNANNYLAYPSSGGYGTHDKYAPAMQGFFVHCNDASATHTTPGSGTVVVSHAARVHNSEGFLKNEAAITNGLIITASCVSNSFTDKISIHFDPTSTAGYNAGYDALKLWGGSESPQLYTRIGDTDVTCNSLPFDKKNIVIPMSFTNSMVGGMTLTASDLQTFESAITITLEDLKLSTTQDLRLNPVYSFTYDNVDNPNRFLLHFNNPSFGIGEKKIDHSLQIYSYHSSIYIKSTDGKDLDGQVFIYDLIGRQVYSGNLAHSSLYRISPKVEEGYYAVKVVGNNGIETEKVYLSN